MPSTDLIQVTYLSTPHNHMTLKKRAGIYTICAIGVGLFCERILPFGTSIDCLNIIAGTFAVEAALIYKSPKTTMDKNIARASGALAIGCILVHRIYQIDQRKKAYKKANSPQAMLAHNTECDKPYGHKLPGDHIVRTWDDEQYEAFLKYGNLSSLHNF